MSKLILASSSPRRKDLLEQMGCKFIIDLPNVSEEILNGESPENLVKRLSYSKAKNVAARNKEWWVLGADTVVSIGGEILGKPENAGDAVKMLSKIQGRQHEVWGGFTIINLSKGVEIVEVDKTLVEILSLSEEEILEYVATNEPMDKAGAYAAQGIGAKFISRIDGAYSNVVGLNISKVWSSLKRLGVL